MILAVKICLTKVKAEYCKVIKVRSCVSTPTSFGILLGGREVCTRARDGDLHSCVQMARVSQIIKALYLLCQVPVLSAPLAHHAQSELN